jgi:hypothetical protein
VQAQTRVRGTITALETNGFVVDGKTQVRLGEKTEIVFTQPVTLAHRANRCVGVDASAGSEKPVGARCAGEPHHGRQPHRIKDPGKSTQAVRTLL